MSARTRARAHGAIDARAEAMPPRNVVADRLDDMHARVLSAYSIVRLASLASDRSEDYSDIVGPALGAAEAILGKVADELMDHVPLQIEEPS